jgi:deaminated glutathione amidase
LAEAGADVLTVPAAFTKQTGEAHWHLLLRARAVETGCFVLAAAQGGHHENGRDTFGHSLVVDPWGRVIAEAGSSRA